MDALFDLPTAQPAEPNPHRCPSCAGPLETRQERHVNQCVRCINAGYEAGRLEFNARLAAVTDPDKARHHAECGGVLVKPVMFLGPTYPAQCAICDWIVGEPYPKEETP